MSETRAGQAFRGCLETSTPVQKPATLWSAVTCHRFGRAGLPARNIVCPGASQNFRSDSLAAAILPNPTNHPIFPTNEAHSENLYSFNDEETLADVAQASEPARILFLARLVQKKRAGSEACATSASDAKILRCAREAVASYRQVATKELPWENGKKHPQPRRGCLRFGVVRLRQPLRGWVFFIRSPRVALADSGNPGLM